MTQFIIAMNGIYASFLYGYIKATTEPLPRGIINHTFRGYTAFEVFMAILCVLCFRFSASAAHLLLRRQWILGRVHRR